MSKIRIVEPTRVYNAELETADEDDGRVIVAVDFEWDGKSHTLAMFDDSARGLLSAMLACLTDVELARSEWVPLLDAYNPLPALPTLPPADVVDDGDEYGS